MKLLHKEEPAIVHRDLNIANLLLREDVSAWRGGSLSDLILISDFSPVGHPRYRAPELFGMDADYTTKVCNKNTLPSPQQQRTSLICLLFRRMSMPLDHCCMSCWSVSHFMRDWTIKRLRRGYPQGIILALHRACPPCSII